MAGGLKSAADRKKAAIRVARKQLGMDDETYRLMLREVTGKSSSTELTFAEVDRVLDHLVKKGFRLTPAKGRPGAEGGRRMDTSPEATKVRALWLLLHELGEVKNPSEQALARYVRRIAKVDDMHWADGPAMGRLIETLKKWAMRVLPGRCGAAFEDLRGRGLASEALAAALSVAVERGTFDPYAAAWEALQRAGGKGL